jgi:hypothetical protein
MKKILFFFLLVVFLSACAAPVPAAVVENTALPVEAVSFTPTPVPTSTAEIQPAPQPTLQAIIQPTESFPTFTPPTALPGKPNEIKFSANGTYADITDSIVAGGSKTYSLNAMQGQIMSVSILPQAGAASTISMQIKGADGSVLCPKLADEQCLFWRGALPASQDYFITLTPDGEGLQFVMRVAINPPGKEFQYFQYSNSATGISLTYPDTFAPALPVLGNYKADPELTLRLIDSELYEKTNLSEVYLMVSSTAEAQTVATCTEPNQSGGGPEQIIGNEVINGLTFVHSTSEGAGAGNYYQQEIYRTVQNNACHEVIFFIHFTNASNYTPGTVTEFNRDAVMQNLQAVLSMISIK